MAIVIPSDIIKEILKLIPFKVIARCVVLSRTAIPFIHETTDAALVIVLQNITNIMSNKWRK